MRLTIWGVAVGLGLMIGATALAGPTSPPGTLGISAANAGQPVAVHTHLVDGQAGVEITGRNVSIRNVPLDTCPPRHQPGFCSRT